VRTSPRHCEAVHGPCEVAPKRGSAYLSASAHLLPIWRRVFANECESHIEKSHRGPLFPTTAEGARTTGLRRKPRRSHWASLHSRSRPHRRGGEMSAHRGARWTTAWQVGAVDCKQFGGRPSSPSTILPSGSKGEVSQRGEIEALDIAHPGFGNLRATLFQCSCCIAKRHDGPALMGNLRHLLALPGFRPNCAATVSAHASRPSAHAPEGKRRPQPRFSHRPAAPEVQA